MINQSRLATVSCISYGRYAKRVKHSPLDAIDYVCGKHMPASFEKSEISLVSGSPDSGSSHISND